MSLLSLLLAFVVRDEDEAEIHFAPSATVLAEELGADEADLARAPEFDAHAPGPVPIAALLAAGWWVECGHCSHHVSKDGCVGGDDEDECPGPTVLRGSAVFCSAACAHAEAEARAARSAKRKACEETALRLVGGEVRIADSWESGAAVTVPGLQGPVIWRADDPDRVQVQARDLPAFEAWRKRHPFVAQEPSA